MDFSFSADQEALRKLAEKAFARGPEVAPELAADGAFGREWAELARAGLTGVTIPVEHGGAGLGVVELAIVCEQAGRAAATAPLGPALVAAATIAQLGDEPQRRLLDGVAAGEVILTPALHEPGGEPARPATRATPDGDGWRLEGVKLTVPGVERAAFVLAPARLPDGAAALFLVAPAEARRERQRFTDDTSPHQLTFAGAPAQLVARGDEALAFLLERAAVAACAYELGVAQRQLEMTAEHVVRRQQFGKPIGTFQAVAQRAADMYIDVTSLRLVTWQAAWQLADGRDASLAVATAAFFAADAGARVAAAAQHLHGGIGFDRAYPLYRYFLAAKRCELELGGAHRQLARLGARLAKEAP